MRMSRFKPPPTHVLALVSASAVAFAFAASAAVPGCTVLTNDALPDDAGTFEGGGGDADSSACASCVELECAGPWAVCLTDSRCLALRACDNPFGESQGSRDQCFCATADAAAPTQDGGADPLPAYRAFASCNDARTCGKCASDCATCNGGRGRTTTAGSCGDGDGNDGGTTSDADAGDAGDAGGGDDGAVPEAPSVDRCETCVSDKCGDAKKLCALESECTAYLACANGCANAGCVDACGKSHASGRTSALELSSCTLTSCRSACGL